MIDAQISRAGYGLAPVLEDVSLRIDEPGLHVLLGRNGAGKTTLLRGLMGLLPELDGNVQVNGFATSGGVALEKVAGAGVTYMPQDGGVFDVLTVEENLRLTDSAEDLAVCMDLFPVLHERRTQRAGTLSGGERKMLGLSRALARTGVVVLLDEPTEGVWHTLVDSILLALAEFASRRCILLVEQSSLYLLEDARTAHVLANGRLAMSGPATDVLSNTEVQELLSLGSERGTTP